MDKEIQEKHVVLECIQQQEEVMAERKAQMARVQVTREQAAALTEKTNMMRVLSHANQHIFA